MNRMDWESVYTIFTLIAIVIGCFACFVSDTWFRFTLNCGIFTYVLGIVASYFYAQNYKEDKEWLS